MEERSIQTTRIQPAEGVANTVRVLVVIQAVIYLLAAALHLGLQTPLAAINLPPLLPAAIVEGSIGIFMVIVAVALFTRWPWAWTTAIVAHGYALLGVLVGILTLSGAFSGGPASTSHDIYYHMLMLLLIVFGLAFLLNPDGKASRVTRMLVRVTGGIQIFLGLVFWVSNADGLIPFHVLIGSVLVLALWALVYIGARAGAPPGFVVLAGAWGLIVPLLGLAQTGLLVGPMHWVIQVVHLLVGIAAIGMAEGLVVQLEHRRAPLEQA